MNMPTDNHVKKAFSLIENDTSKVLGLKIGDQSIQPGQYVTRQAARTPPQLSFSGADPTKTYIIVNLDIDAPFPSCTTLSPILHWIQPGVKIDGTSSLDTNKPFVANYIPPSPPPGSSPHRYIFFLYEEPEGFDYKKYAPPDGKNLANWHRIRFDFDSWGEKIGLGPVLAFNYFKCN
ncbi:hypothetical protein PENSTE_c032G03549 [Penicillium steckii]|uniref:Phosphatidylethanolamine-binding protein n=1 Tax=Penicillium steckii TaxID=303698 RepID=A0A1V6SLZ3_9EURO|nr:hypothetical protein PENSTE_c032G03549 [Penicillium steckii]